MTARIHIQAALPAVNPTSVCPVTQLLAESGWSLEASVPRHRGASDAVTCVVAGSSAALGELKRTVSAATVLGAMLPSPLDADEVERAYSHGAAFVVDSNAALVTQLNRLLRGVASAPPARDDATDALLEDSFRGLIAGVAVGDTVGLPVEGHPIDSTESYIQGLEASGPCGGWHPPSAPPSAASPRLVAHHGSSRHTCLLTSNEARPQFTVDVPRATRFVQACRPPSRPGLTTVEGRRTRRPWRRSSATRPSPCSGPPSSPAETASERPGRR